MLVDGVSQMKKLRYREPNKPIKEFGNGRAGDQGRKLVRPQHLLCGDGCGVRHHKHFPKSHLRGTSLLLIISVTNENTQSQTGGSFQPDVLSWHHTDLNFFHPFGRTASFIIPSLESFLLI